MKTAQYSKLRYRILVQKKKQELDQHCLPKRFGLKLIDVFTGLHAQVLDQTILRSTQQQQSLPHVTTILLTERGTTPTV